jgi:polyhydroxyalkanoate synthase subunit PhaC
VANVDKPDVPATAESHAANASQARGDRPIEAGQVDRAFHATLARLTGGISPVALSLAYFDWASHLAAAPQRRMEIAQDAVRTAGRIFESALHCTEPGYGPWSLIKPQPQDRRFAASEWESPPFNLLAQHSCCSGAWSSRASALFPRLQRGQLSVSFFRRAQETLFILGREKF